VGSVRYGEQPLALDLTLRWPHSVLPPEWVGQPLASRGTLVLKGNPSAFDARGTLAVGPPDRLANVAFAMRGSSQALAIEQLTIIQESGRLVAHGEVELRPVLTWQLEADATRFDPGEFLVAWPGDVDFALTTSGRLTQKGPRAELQLSRFAGTLRHRAVSGQANLALAPNQVVSGTLQVASGRSSIRVRGRPGEELDLSVIAQVASLDDWVPNARGALNGRFDVTGRWPDVQLAGSARGTALAFGDSRARIVRANVDLESVAERRGLITLNAREVLAGGFEFAEVGIHTEGDPGDHVVRFRARGTPVSAELSARGGQTDGGWTGTIERLAIAALDVPRLALREPVKVVANAEQFSVSESCLSGENVSFCVAASGNPQGRMQGRYSIENLPLALVRAVTAPELPLGVGGTLQGRGQITRNTDGTLIGRAQLVSDSGYIGYEEIVEEPLLTYENLRLDAQLAGTEAHATLSGALSDGGSIEAEATASELLHPSPALSGRARVSLGTLRAIEIFTPQLAAVQGRGEARASFSGRPGSLGLAGAIEVHDFAAEVPALGLKLREGAFEASLEPAGGARFAGQITSAEGQVTIEGTASPTGTINAQIKGNQVLVADIPAGRIVVDPALTLTRTPEQVSLVGTIELPDATIDLTKLPQGRAGQRASPDVVVIDEPPEEKEQDEFPLYTNVTIVIGPEVELAGFGLEAIVAGRLVVREKPGEEPVASGEVNLEGTYKAYGQDLTIERGRLLYAGTTLGNPQLDIIAVRELPDVTAQLRVTGTAQQPQLAVSSDPAMSQTEALSYLVRGKPVNQLTSEDNDVMQTAARSLGGAAGNLLAKSLGRRLGIDEIGIEQSTELGGSVFTIGEYLSPRLYLSYGWGLFEPGEIVTLRYEISDEWALQASQGPEEQRAGIEYRIER
jgi:translocation and assembly module TamB